MPKVGSQNPQARDAGSWKGWSKFWARHDGSWKRPLSVFVKSGGSWVEVWDETPTVSGVSTYIVDTGELWLAYKTATVAANGFTTSVTSNANGGLTTSSISVDVSMTIQAFNYIQYFQQITYPSITVTNSSGSVTF